MTPELVHPMDPEEVPPLPGFDVTEPNASEFFLHGQLEGRESAPVPDDLADVMEWIGASDHERGRALRDVLRLYDRIARSRGAVRETEAARFPRFEVRPARQAS